MQIHVLHGHVVLKVVARTVPVIKVDAPVITILSAAAEIRQARTRNFDVTKHNSVGRRGDADSRVVIARGFCMLILMPLKTPPSIVTKLFCRVMVPFITICESKAGFQPAVLDPQVLSVVAARLMTTGFPEDAAGTCIKRVRISSAGDTHGRPRAEAGPTDTSQIAPRAGPTAAISGRAGTHEKDRCIGMDRRENNDERHEVLRGGSPHYALPSVVQD